MTEKPKEDQSDPPLKLRLGNDELVISRRYEAASILNDFMLGIWFLAGSVLFLFPAWKDIGVWLFILGSFQLVMRPSIRLARRIHVKRVPGEETNW